jgi:hypothetical protein
LSTEPSDPATLEPHHYSNLNDTVEHVAEHYRDVDGITKVDDNDQGYEELTLSPSTNQPQPYELLSIDTPNSHTYVAPPITDDAYGAPPITDAYGAPPITDAYGAPPITDAYGAPPITGE